MSMTLDKLEELCLEIKLQRDECDAAHNAKKYADTKLKRLEDEFLKVLEDLGRDSYDSVLGKFYTQARVSYRTPKTYEERQALFDFMREKGVFWDMASIHSATLNAWAKKEFEAAMERGEFDFSIPGIDQPSVEKTLAFRKK